MFKIFDYRLLIVWCLTALQIFGEATMKVQPPLIELSESATLSIEVRNTKNPHPPSIPNVQGLAISYAGQSTQHSWVNGKSDSFTAFNYKIYPQKTGTFTIGPFAYGAQTLQAEVKVVAGSDEVQQAQSWSDLLFAKLETDRDSAYVQEPFNLTLSIYSRQGLEMSGNIGLNGMPQTGLPELKWKEGQPGRKVINGSIFEVRRFTARTRAMGSGSFEFKPAVTVPIVIPNQNRRSRDPFFGSMFQRTETRPVNVPVDQVTVNVKPLPDTNRPESFNGAVGRFTFQTTAKPTTVNVGDPITLQCVIRGDGNFDRVMMPPLPTDDSFRLFGDPVRKQIDGAVVFEQVISPRSEEISEIPAIAFSFFDTQSGQYKTVRSAAIPISVSENSNGSAQVFAAKETINAQAPQDHAFATESDVQRAAQWLSKVWKKIRPWLWVIPALLIAWAIGFAGNKLFHRHQQDTARLRRKKAPSEARKALKRATHALHKEDDPAFFDELWQALGGYFANSLNLSSGETTPDGIAAELRKLTVTSEQIEALQSTLMKIEAHRYNPGKSGLTPSEKQAIKKEVDELLKRFSSRKLKTT